VVVPHELYESLADNHDALAHVLDGHEGLHHLNGHVMDAVGHAEAAGAAEHLPVIGPIIVVVLAVGLNYKSYRQGKVSPEEAVRNVGERGLLTVLASGAGWAAALLAHEPVVGLPTSVLVRLFGGQLFHNRRRREVLDSLIGSIEESRWKLALQVQRPILETAASS